MMRINSDSIVDMIFHLKWKSESAIHTDGYQASRINIWRDFFPPNLLDEIRDRQAGDRIEVKLRQAACGGHHRKTGGRPVLSQRHAKKCYRGL